MKLKKDQKTWLEWIRKHGTARGMTLGRGRPHDSRVIQSLIDKWLIMPINRAAANLADYAIRGEEDKNGLALISWDGIVYGATVYGCPVRPYTDDDYQKDHSDSALQNGIDTSWELYPDDEVRREWMQWASARDTLAMHEDELV